MYKSKATQDCKLNQIKKLLCSHVLFSIGCGARLHYFIQTDEQLNSISFLWFRVSHKKYITITISQYAIQNRFELHGA